jgi:hypothetical protein
LIAVRILSKQAVTKRLRELGCERILDTPLKDHSVWKAPSGFVFTVPELGPDDRCPATTLENICQDIETHGKAKT